MKEDKELRDAARYSKMLSSKIQIPMEQFVNPPNATFQGIKVGDKIKFEGAKIHWFKNWIDNARLLLKKDNIYTVSSITVASSSTSVTLEETGDAKFCLSWFSKVS